MAQGLAHRGFSTAVCREPTAPRNPPDRWRLRRFAGAADLELFGFVAAAQACGNGRAADIVYNNLTVEFNATAAFPDSQRVTCRRVVVSTQKHP